MLTLTTPALPPFRQAPTGPMLRVLRRMLTVPLVTTVAGGRVVAAVGPEAVSPSQLAGLVTRNLVAEVESDERRSVYGLTELGRRWANEESPR